MKKLLAIAILIAGTMVMVSCSEDEDPVVLTAPSVSVASAPSAVENGSTGNTATFTITVDASLTINESAISVTTSGDLSNATSALDGSTVTVTFDAGTTAGAASVVVAYTDEAGSDDATAVININAIDDRVITISTIPANASISEGGSLSMVPYQV